MALVSKQFNEVVTFTRASGATRVNTAGLIVGVDFSSTSNTIGTGSKTFTLTADANVNRDWVVGSNVIAVSQAGATGSMTGTVTSYTASTQELVINVTSITGSGTSTDWRIGSLEFRRDFDPATLAPRGGLVEGQATNLLVRSQDFANASWTKENQGTYTATITANAGTAPDGSNNATLFSGNSGANGSQGYTSIWQNPSTVAGVPYTSSIWVKASSASDVGKKVSLLSDNGVGLSETVITLTAEWTKYAAKNNSIAAISNKKCVFIYTSGTNNTSNNEPVNALIWGGQFESGAVATSYIPTTTVAVTRAADLLNIDGTRFGQAYNQSQGTLYVEMTPTAAAVQAVSASINDGTLNNAIRIGQKQSGTLSSIRAIASDGVTDVMGLNRLGGVLVADGVNYSDLTGAVNATTNFGVASGGASKFLVVGEPDAIHYSGDSGLNYSKVWVDGSFGAYAGAHFGIGRFVIAGSTSLNGASATVIGSVIVSTDGLSFRRINIPGLTQNLNEVTSNGSNQYVAVGNGGVIYTSPDAETWTAQTSGTASALTGAYFFGGRYVAVSSTSGASLYSDNGTSWTAVTGLAASMQDVAHNGTNLWVAVGNGGAIYSSADGITWTSRTSGVTATLNGVHFADGLWVAVGAVGTVVTSPDGITWTDRTATSGTVSLGILEVGFFNGKFYYVGGAAILFENTAAGIVAGTTWTNRTPNIGSTFAGLATDGSRLLVCGSLGGIATSDDGATFTSRTGNNTTLNGAAFGAGTYVVVGNAVNGSGLIATVDPTTFAYTRRVSGVNSNINGVRFLNGAFYAVLNGGTLALLRSTDGINYSPITTVNAQFRDIAYSGSRYVAVCNANDAMTSTDGINFTNMLDFVPLTNGVTASTTWLSIDFASGVFVTVGTGGAIAWSMTGAPGTWNTAVSGTTRILYAVRWSTRDQCFYAAGDSGVILRSSDGITWENIANDAIGAVIRNGSIQSNPQLQNLVVGIPNKVAMRIKENDFAVSVNGNDAVIDTSALNPVVSRMSLGMSGTATLPFNGWIRKLDYFPFAKSNAELKQLST